MRNRSFFSVLLIGSAMLSMGTVSAQSEHDAAKVSTEVVQEMEARNFDAVRARFNDEMKTALSVESLAQVQTQMETAGAVKSIGEPKLAEDGPITVAVIRVDRTQASLNATIAVDENGKIAGLHYGAAPAEE